MQESWMDRRSGYWKQVGTPCSAAKAAVLSTSRSILVGVDESFRSWTDHRSASSMAASCASVLETLVPSQWFLLCSVLEEKPSVLMRRSTGDENFSFPDGVLPGGWDHYCRSGWWLPWRERGGLLGYGAEES